MAELNWDDEHARWEREMRGLVRSLGIKNLRMKHRPRACWTDMITDMEITSWAAWRSLRLRQLNPQAIGVYAISLRCVRQVMAGRAFRPLQARGDRSWADSIYRKANGVNVRSNREPYQLEGSVGDGQEESDLLADWLSFKKTLQDDDSQMVEALEAGNTATLTTVKSIKRRKGALADRFKEFRNG